MTVDEVRQRVAGVEEALPDNEEAHIREDALFEDVLKRIAAGEDDAKTMASLADAALEATRLRFQRWCA